MTAFPKIALLAIVVAAGAILYAYDDYRQTLYSAIIAPLLSSTTVEHQCRHGHSHFTSSPVVCPVQPSPRDVGPTWDPAADPEFRELARQRLVQAIQIRTETFDTMPMNASDPVFDVFYDFERYLRQTFPLFHEKLEFERVNTHGLLFEWKGSDPALKPMLLMAHQDVVPVPADTLHQWTHPPFAGHMDESGWIWGRGTTDMKGTLVALFSVAERLLQEGFQPERTIVFSHGFDEEIGGERGAKFLAEVVEARYGKDGISIIVDEGFTGVDDEFGMTFARVGLAEKGCMTLEISVATEGGHSSRPPAHTGVGIISRLLVELENHPNPVRLLEGNPLLTYLECAAQHSVDMDESLRSMVRSQECWPLLANDLAMDRVLRTFLHTTQAVDVVQGGSKFNALPETARSLINYRIDFFESTDDTINKVTSLLKPLANHFNLTFAAFDEHPEVTQNIVRLKTFGIRLEPAPITPATGDAWDLMGGTITNLFPGVIVVPSAMTAFTDTQFFWDVSKHIYRFVPASLELIKNYHTINERIHIDAHLSTVKFFYKLIQNSQSWQAP